MAPNKFAVDWVQGNALERIRALVSERLERDMAVAVEVGSRPLPVAPLAPVEPPRNGRRPSPPPVVLAAG